MISWIVVVLQQFFLQMFVHPGIFFLGSRRLGPSQGGKDGPQQGARRRRRRGPRCRVVECAAEPPRPLVCPLTHPHGPKHGFLNFPWNSPHNDGSLNQGYRLWRVRKLGANGMTDGEEENFGQSSLLFRAAAKFQGVVFHKHHFPRVCTISNPVCASLPPGPHTPVFFYCRGCGIIIEVGSIGAHSSLNTDHSPPVCTTQSLAACWADSVLWKSQVRR